MVFMGLDHISTVELYRWNEVYGEVNDNPRTIQERKNLISEMSEYNLEPGKVYSIHSLGQMRWIDTKPDTVNSPMSEITKQLISCFFKTVSELRDDKINEILK